MTRRAKEKRLERVQGKRKEEEERLERNLRLQSRSEWCHLLASIDKNEEILPSTQVTTSIINAGNNSTNATPFPVNKATERSQNPPPVSHLQWKSSNVPIAAADAFELAIGLETPTGTLHYEFSTVDYDIEFEVQMIQEDGTTIDVVENQRFLSHEETIRGSHELAGPGTIFIVWDNSYSWWTAKQLKYRLQLDQHLPSKPTTTTVSSSSPSKPIVVIAPHLPPGIRRALEERNKREADLLEKEKAYEAWIDTIDGYDDRHQMIQRQIQLLHEELQVNQLEKERAQKLEHEANEIVETLKWEIEALTWRCFDLKTLETIVYFANKKDLGLWLLVNKKMSTIAKTRLSTSSNQNETNPAAEISL